MITQFTNAGTYLHVLINLNVKKIFFYHRICQKIKKKNNILFVIIFLIIIIIVISFTRFPPRTTQLENITAV